MEPKKYGDRKRYLGLLLGEVDGPLPEMAEIQYLQRFHQFR